jgi:hypothetical protein
MCDIKGLPRTFKVQFLVVGGSQGFAIGTRLAKRFYFCEACLSKALVNDHDVDCMADPSCAPTSLLITAPMLPSSPGHSNRGRTCVSSLVSGSRPVHPGSTTRLRDSTVPIRGSDARQTNARRHSCTPQEGTKSSSHLTASLLEPNHRKESHKNRLGRASNHPSSKQTLCSP